MAAYRERRPARAEQFDGFHADQLLALLGEGVTAIDILMAATPEGKIAGGSTLNIVWRGTALTVKPGEWLVRDGAGNMLVLHDAAFTATYEPAVLVDSDDPADMAQACRRTLNCGVFGGDAPHDSNALSEVWPTAGGAAFEIQGQGRRFAVIVTPPDVAGDLARPHYEPATDGGRSQP